MKRPKRSRQSSTSTINNEMAASANTLVSGAARKGRAARPFTLNARKTIWAWGFLALPIGFYCWIRFYPTLWAFCISFTDWNLLNPPSFIGLANYRTLLADPVFWKVFKNTFTYLVIGTPVSLLLAFVVAFYLDRVRVLHGLIRALYFLPFLT